MNPKSPEEIILLFNEKTDRLFQLSYWSNAKHTRASVEFHQNTGWNSIFEGPNEEAIEAFVLTLRMFMQDNDNISLRKMRGFYENRFPGELSSNFLDNCNCLNAFLDSPTNLSIEEGKQLTYRDILDIFIYGQYAHTNQIKRQIFEGIRTTAFFPIFQQYLIRAISAFGGCLKELKKINEEALIKLSTEQ
jgi:hypothetical protein